MSTCAPAKTGFISKAGYCLATLLRLPQGGQQVAVVVLGARSNAGRFMETRESLHLAVEQGVDGLRDDAPRRSPPQSVQLAGLHDSSTLRTVRLRLIQRVTAPT